MTVQLFTIGHSTHPLENFLKLLNQHGIKILADIRRFPGSRKFPQFNQENLATALRNAGIEYHWLQGLGGRRQKSTLRSEKNLGLRNESFRNYADYMLTPEFHEHVQKLLQLGAKFPTAFMCSESVFWRCHRRLVSDYLCAQGIFVQHIMPTGDLRPHSLTPEARVDPSGELTYPPAAGQQQMLPW